MNKGGTAQERCSRFVVWLTANRPEVLLKSYEKTVAHDQIKTQYCKNNSIALIRIPYWEKDNINNILTEWFKNNQGVNNAINMYK